MSPPTIQTYHCICSSLLLASTHSLSSLPRRGTPSLDVAIIVPVPESLPDLSEPQEEEDDESAHVVAEKAVHGDGESESASKEKQTRSKDTLPMEGYTKLLGMVQDRKTTIIRREDGFEKRALWRCARCEVPVGYELPTTEGNTLVEEGGYVGKLIYLFPGGLMSTQAMVKAGTEGRKLQAEDVGIGKGVVAAWE